jgi:hypothetical protein
MTRTGFLALGTALLAPLLLAPALADAQSIQGSVVAIYGPGSPKVISTQEIPARFAGLLTVDFHGDPASGCASAGLCGYAGTVAWQPPPTGSVEILEDRVYGHLHYELDLTPNSDTALAFGGVTTSSVKLSTAAGVASNCLDASSAGASLMLPLAHGRVAFTLADTSPSLLTSRCAGPLESDIAPELPAPTLSLAAVQHGRTTISLDASHPFSSHGFAGTVDSTLSVALGKPGRRTRPRANTVPKGIPTERYRQLDVTYRASVSGTAVDQVQGDANPAICAPLGSCGLSGTLTFAPAAKRVAAELVFATPARKPARDLLAAVGLRRGAGTKGVTATGAVSWSNGGEVAALLHQSGSTCSDSAPLGGGSILLAAGKGRLVALYLPGLGSALRTRCPGPESSNAVALASAEVPMSRLRRRTTTLTLSSTRPFLDYGYDIRPEAHLTLTLTRVNTHSQVVVEPTGFP